MIRAVRFSPFVAFDLQNAVAWHDRQQRNLGDRFLADFRFTVDRISRTGAATRKVHGEFRRIKFEVFPYLVYFRDTEDGFFVALVIHAARDPELTESLLTDRR